MHRITFHCRTISPMFLSGPDTDQAELRAPSIKGAMRFWWRALNGHLVEKKDGKWDYSKLKEEEGKIFGDTKRRSSFSIQVEWQNRLEGKLPLPDTGIKVGDFNNDIFKFMTYGLWDHKNPSNNREYIGPGSTFTCKLIIINSSHTEEILNSFYCLVHFGGIGAKARNGFGGVNVSEVQLLSNYKIDVNAFTGDIKEYSCFSTDSKYHLVCIENTWSSALAKTLNDRLFSLIRFSP